MTDVTAETVIARPREDVARYASDWRNDTDWIRGLREARQVTDDELGVGTRVLRVASFLGRRVEYVNEIAEWEPGRRLVMRSVQAPFPMVVTYEWDDAGTGTRMRIRARGDASGFYRAAGPLLGPLVKRTIQGDLERLKQTLERRA
jgi:hypothetical protein